MTEAFSGEMTFLQHLEELRKRLIRALAGLVVGFLLCLTVARTVYGWLVRPVVDVLPEGEKLAFTQLTDPFLLYMKVSFLVGIFLMAPYIVLQLWLFIAPGL
ncbi:MAG: twin-arginine translocase subunit TatC, partial [Dehalococcoidia bacterium]